MTSKCVSFYQQLILYNELKLIASFKEKIIVLFVYSSNHTSIFITVTTLFKLFFKWL